MPPRYSQLGIGAHDEPGPAVGLLGRAQRRGGPAQGVLHEAVGVLDVEAVQVGVQAQLPGRLAGTDHQSHRVLLLALELGFGSRSTSTRTTLPRTMGGRLSPAQRPREWRRGCRLCQARTRTLP